LHTENALSEEAYREWEQLKNQFDGARSDFCPPVFRKVTSCSPMPSGLSSTRLSINIRPRQSEAVLVGGRNVLKPALRLMTSYRLAIDEITDSHAITIYTRWVDAVHLKRGENEEVYLTFSPILQRIWLGSKKRLLKFADKKPANIGFRSRYALRLYSWAKQYVTAGSKRISLEELRKILGLGSIKDATATSSEKRL
jgi:hypothetical protein